MTYWKLRISGMPRRGRRPGSAGGIGRNRRGLRLGVPLELPVVDLPADVFVVPLEPGCPPLTEAKRSADLDLALPVAGGEVVPLLPGPEAWGLTAVGARGRAIRGDMAGRPGSARVGNPRNDSTWHRTTASSPLSSVPYAATTSSTSPWSTCTCSRSVVSVSTISSDRYPTRNPYHAITPARVARAICRPTRRRGPDSKPSAGASCS